MNNLQQILEMWKTDSLIDEINLDETSRDSAKLHSKYLELLSVNRLQLKRAELEFKVLLRDKWMHYNGKMPKEQIDEKGWDYDPLNGLTVLKGDMDRYYDADPLIQEHQAKMQYIEEICSTLKEILDNVKWRHQTIGNIIRWKQFEAGM